MRRLVSASSLVAACIAAGDALAAPEPTGPTPAAQAVARAVDAKLEKAWREAGITPRAAATDAEFLRRLSLDLRGTIPDEETARAFLADRSEDKRARLIATWVGSEEWAREQALRWTYVLVGRDYLIRAKTRVAAFRLRRQQGMAPAGNALEALGFDPDQALFLDEWIAERLLAGAGWDVIARELIAAEGRVDQNPAAHYALRYARDGKAAEATGNVMRAFQGLQLQCAQCHDHPYSEVTQRQFWGVAAFFARTAARRAPLPDAMARAVKKKKKKKPKGPFVVFERPRGQARLPADKGQTGALVLPRFLTGEVIDPGNGVARRKELARLITAPTNPYFAKATVNRVWSHFFGRGLIDPVDEIDQEDAPLLPVLNFLAEDFRRSGYDMRRLAAVIANTRAYQLSSAGPAEGRDDELALFARAPLRSLSAEQLFTSVLQVTGAEDLRQTQNRQVRRRLERMKFGLLRQFLRVFGTDEEEVVDEGTIPQALMRFNGPLTNDAIRPRPGHPVYDRLFALGDLDARLDVLYLRTLSRTPTEVERARLRRFLRDVGPRARAQAQAYADVLWALLNSAEFNHIH